MIDYDLYFEYPQWLHTEQVPTECSPLDVAVLPVALSHEG